MAENVARVDLNPVDQARAYAMLSDELDLTQADIAATGRQEPPVGGEHAAAARAPRCGARHDRRRHAVGGPRPGGAAGRWARTSGSRSPAWRSSGGLSVRPDRGCRQADADQAQEGSALGGARVDGRRAREPRRRRARGPRSTSRRRCARGPRGGRVELHFTQTAPSSGASSTSCAPSASPGRYARGNPLRAHGVLSCAAAPGRLAQLVRAPL